MYDKNKRTYYTNGQISFYNFNNCNSVCCYSKNITHREHIYMLIQTRFSDSIIPKVL